MTARYRVGVLADIHGNLSAFRAVMADLDRHGPLDGLLAAGDIICGPGQAEILDALIERRAVMVQGNNEQALARMAAGRAGEHVYRVKQYSLRRWCYEHLTPGQLEAVYAMPEQAVFTLPGADAIRVMHGSPRSAVEGIVPEEMEHFFTRTVQVLGEVAMMRPAQAFALAGEPVLVCGHTHLPWSEALDGRLAVNPGAVSFPGNGFVGAQYALLAWDGRRWTPEFHAIRYDMEAERRMNEESGYLASGPLAQIFLRELLTGRDHMLDFFSLANRLAEEAGAGDLPYIRDDIWEQAWAEYNR